MVPYLPVPPSLVRILLEVVWVPWALVATLQGRVLAASYDDDLEVYTARLWG
jgi:hypothetical protein